MSIGWLSLIDTQNGWRNFMIKLQCCPYHIGKARTLGPHYDDVYALILLFLIILSIIIHLKEMVKALSLFDLRPRNYFYLWRAHISPQNCFEDQKVQDIYKELHYACYQ